MGDDTVDVRDFSVRRRTLVFRVDETDDVYTAEATVTTPVLQELVRQAQQFGGDLDVATLDAKIDGLTEIIVTVLTDDCKKRFRDAAPRLDVVEQLIPIIMWLLESYGMRPTQPSSDSFPQVGHEPDTESHGHKIGRAHV